MEEIDSDSALDNFSLKTSEMLDQIVEGKIANPTLPYYDCSYKSVGLLDRIMSPTSCAGTVKQRLVSADSGVESHACQGTEVDRSSICVQLNVDKQHYQTWGDVMMEMQSMTTDCNQCNKSENEMVRCKLLQAAGHHGSDHASLPQLAEINMVNDYNSMQESREKIIGYVGLEVVDEGNDVFKASSDSHKRVEVEICDQDHDIPKSTENFDYIGLEIDDQNHCIPKATERLDYNGLEVCDQGHDTPELTEEFRSEVVSQNHPRPAENFDGMKATNQNTCKFESIEEFDYIGVELVNQDHFLSKSAEIFDYPRLEVVNQDHCHLPMQLEKINPDQDYHVLNSTEESDIVAADQDHNVSNSHYVGLEIFGHQPSTQGFTDHTMNEDHQSRNLTEKIGVVFDKEYCIPGSTEKFDSYVGLEIDDQKCKTYSQCSYEEYNSNHMHDSKGSDEVKTVSSETKRCLRFNDDGYVISLVSPEQ